jgi:hypothetical protein
MGRPHGIERTASTTSAREAFCGRSARAFRDFNMGSLLTRHQIATQPPSASPSLGVRATVHYVVTDLVRFLTVRVVRTSVRQQHGVLLT